MHVGVAHHLGWAVLVTATSDHQVVDRRRVALVADDLPSAPIHDNSGVHPMHDSGDPLDDPELDALAERVRHSAQRLTAEAFTSLAEDLATPIASISLRSWPSDFPTDIETLRKAPFESRADSVMYREVIADHAEARGWQLHLFDAKTVEQEASDVLGGSDLLERQRVLLGSPWNKDHRIAFAATIVASRTRD